MSAADLLVKKWRSEAYLLERRSERKLNQLRGIRPGDYTDEQKSIRQSATKDFQKAFDLRKLADDLIRND